MTGWKGGPVPGQIMADLENGLYFGATRLKPRPPLGFDFVTALVKGKGGARFTLKSGNAQAGGLETIYDGPRPDGPGGNGHPTKRNSYDPMKLQGAILLGTGGDNSHSGVGTWFEGLMLSGYSTDAADAAVQANIVAAGYGK